MMLAKNPKPKINRDKKNTPKMKIAIPETLKEYWDFENKITMKKSIGKDAIKFIKEPKSEEIRMFILEKFNFKIMLAFFKIESVS